MLNYNKIHFSEKDVEEPTQYFFTYELSEEELDKFLAYYINEGEIPEKVTVEVQELCLTEHSSNDYALEVVFYGDDNKQYWVTLLSSTTRRGIRELLDKVV